MQNGVKYQPYRYPQIEIRPVAPQKTRNVCYKNTDVYSRFCAGSGANFERKSYTT